MEESFDIKGYYIALKEEFDKNFAKALECKEPNDRREFIYKMNVITNTLSNTMGCF